MAGRTADPRSSTRYDALVDDADPRITTLLQWFADEGEDWPWRHTRDRWHILVSEICLQQTQAARGAVYVERIMDQYPTPSAMASSDLGELLTIWQGLGYPRRARNLHAAATHITSDGWPDDYRDLPGVGPYTADALRCFADEEAVIPVDINTRRVGERLFDSDIPVLDDHAWTWGQAVMELGQTHCRAKARCGGCPVEPHCPSAGTDEVIASARQAKYEGSMRQRRGKVLAALTSGEQVSRDIDAEAVAGLLADGLIRADGDVLQLP